MAGASPGRRARADGNAKRKARATVAPGRNPAVRGECTPPVCGAVALALALAGLAMVGVAIGRRKRG